METSTVSSRSTVRAVLAFCLVASILAFGFVLMRGNRPARISSRDIPMPFGSSKGTSLRGQLSEIGTTVDNRPIVDMTFDNGEVSEPFGTNNITFVVTPSDPATFSAGASLKTALTAGKKIYG